MPKRPENYMTDRRDRILDAVELCCREKGWNQTSLRDVAAAAGLSKGGLYVHFPTKTELLKAILQRNKERIGILADAADPEAFVAQMVGRIAYIGGPAARESAISQNELQLEGIRNPELRPLVEEVAREAVRVMEVVVTRFCPKLGPQQVRDRALSILFFLEGLRNYAAMAGDASLEDAQRIAARELRVFLERGSG